MKKFKKILSIFLLSTLSVSLVACGGAPRAEEKVIEDSDLDYTYGWNTTFWSKEPVTYTMMYSDYESYPYQEDWLLWKTISEKTNVSFDLNIIARPNYDDKTSLLINGGAASYIITKIYDESAYVAGGAVVPISDWVQYMPNYQKFVEAYDMEKDLKTITRSDGKYYRLPGMWEKPGGTGNEYTLVIRKDIFDAAGVDVTALEKDWTWEEFYECLLKVQDYQDGGSIWSDRWKGEVLLQMMGQSYGVPAGWRIHDGMQYNAESDSFYFAETSDDYKAFIMQLSKFCSSGILDSETFAQEEEAALTKFYTGKTFIISGNRSTNYEEGMNQTLGKGNYELYYIIPPVAKNSYQTDNTRLENGIMINQTAIEELGEEGFIKMLRFIDWLWYSKEGKNLCRWGIEGETYTEEDGTKKLMSNINYNNLNPGKEKRLNADYGFANGTFMYGGTTEQATSMLSPELVDFFKRLNKNRKIRPLDPTVIMDEDQTEEMNMMKTPLIDYVKSATLQFVTGQSDIEEDWDKYLAECKSNNAEAYLDKYNEIYNIQKK